MSNTTMTLFNKSIFILLFFMLMINSLQAQFGSFGSIDPRSQGLGGTSNSVSGGIYSIGNNPANLIVNANSFIDFITVLPFPSVSINSGSNLVSLDDINYFFGGIDGQARVLTEADKKRFTGLMENGGLLFGTGGFSIFSFGINLQKEIGSFAFTINDAAGVNLNLPKALPELLLNGNQLGKTFNLDDSDVKAWWIRSYALTHARDISTHNFPWFEEIAIGVSLKFINGFSYVGTERSNYNFTTGPSHEITGSTDMLGYSSFSDAFGVKYDFDSVQNKGAFNLFPSPAGTGFGLDFGVTAIQNNWTFSLALTDIGKINWYKNAAEFSSFGKIYVDDILNNEQIDSLENRLKGNSRKIDNFSTALPAALRLGASYQFNETLVPGSLLLAIDYDQGFNNLPGNSKYPLLSLGAEWKPMDWIPYIRTGFSFNADFGINWSAGLGIDINVVEIHIASSTMQSFVAPKHTRRIGFSIGSRWKI